MEINARRPQSRPLDVPQHSGSARAEVLLRVGGRGDAGRPLFLEALMDSDDAGVHWSQLVERYRAELNVKEPAARATLAHCLVRGLIAVDEKPDRLEDASEPHNPNAPSVSANNYPFEGERRKGNLELNRFAVGERTRGRVTNGDRPNLLMAVARCSTAEGYVVCGAGMPPGDAHRGRGIGQLRRFSWQALYDARPDSLNSPRQAARLREWTIIPE